MASLEHDKEQEHSASDGTLSNGGSDREEKAIAKDERGRNDGETRNENDGTGDEEAGDGNNGPPKPVGFWDKRLNSTRLDVIKNWAFMLTILCTFILAVLSLYWAVLINVENNLNSLIIFVVDFDTESTALVGPMVTKMTEQIVEQNAMPHLGYVTVPPSQFDNDPLQVREAVFSQQAWAAIVVNANATTLLRQAVELGNASYDPLGACQFIFEDARDQDTYYDYILPQINTLQTNIVSAFGSKWTAQVLSNASIPRQNLEKVPQALSPAIGFSSYNLRQFYPYLTIPAVTVGLIYLIIIAFFSFSFFLPIHMKFVTPQGHPPLIFWQLVLWRWVSTIAAYLMLSLSYSLVSLAFQIPFWMPPVSHLETAANATAYGRGSFPVYWMVNFVGMTALGLACENVAMVVGFPWTSMWLIFWVISNVAKSFYAIELSPGFFRWGYAWPLHNIVEASRTILFGLHSRLGLNFGVLFAWVAVDSLLFPCCCYFMRWKNKRAERKEREGKEGEKEEKKEEGKKGQ